VASTPGIKEFTIPLHTNVPILQDSYIRVNFTTDGAGCGTISSRPRLVTTAACSLCVAWNYSAADTSDLCDVLFPGSPLIWAPVDSCVTVAPVLGVGQQPLAVRDLRVEPNPMRGVADVSFALADPAEVAVDIRDVAGRHVRQVWSGRLPSGAHVARWDGRDDQGTQVAPGCYFAVVRVDQKTASRRLLVTR
jgi:hypothetical protein